MNSLHQVAQRYKSLSSAGIVVLLSMGATATTAKVIDERLTTPNVEWEPTYGYGKLTGSSVSAFTRDVSATAPLRAEASKTYPNIDVPLGIKRRGQLFEAIQSIRQSLNDWDNELGSPPSFATLMNAEIALAMLPQSYADPKLGLGGSGDLYFSWENSKGVAFLTIDSNELHLLLKPKVMKPVYWDKLAYDNQVLQNKILPALAQFAS